jgi:hypothetical protein
MRFDDRQTCFHTGKKISPPMNERKLCACCGQRIVKGEILTIGHVGDDCADIIKRRQTEKNCFGTTVQQFCDKWSKICGKMKPAIRRTLDEHYA